MSIQTDWPSPHLAPAPQPDAAQAAAELAGRLLQIEQMQDNLVQAINAVVSGLLEVKALAQRAADPAVNPARVSELERKLAEQAQELSTERACRHLAEVSRSYAKTRSMVFMGAKYFGDNVKYAWLAFRQRAAELGIELWFLPPNEACAQQVRELGGNCLPVAADDWSSEDVARALRAAVLVTSDHLLSANPYAAALFAGARHVQLWHGLSIKEVGYVSNMAPLARMTPYQAYVLRTCGPFAAYVGTAAALEPEWRRWFSYERYSVAGYPRTDVLYREPGAEDLVNVDADIYGRMAQARREGRAVYFYTPTYRDADHGHWIEKVGLQQVAQQVQDAGGLLVVNLHPVEQELQAELQGSFPGVPFVRAGTDIYPLLTQTTALVTDYSSLIFDYLHIDRPVVLFRPDHEDYVARSRKLSDAKLTPLPGPVAHTAEELAALLADPAALDAPAHRADRHTLIERLFEGRDGRAAERVGDLLLGEMDRALARQATA